MKIVMFVLVCAVIATLLPPPAPYPWLLTRTTMVTVGASQYTLPAGTMFRVVANKGNVYYIEYITACGAPQGEGYVFASVSKKHIEYDPCASGIKRKRQ